MQPFFCMLFIFDLDGTLADSKDSIVASVKHSLGSLGLSKLQVDEIFVTQHDLATSFKKISEDEKIDFDSRLCDLFIQNYRKHQIEEAESMLQLYPKVVETLDQLRSDFQLAVATTKHSVQAKRVLERLEISSYFSHIQGTDPGLRYKPHPDILLRCLEIMNVEGQDAAYVGDSLHDMHAARGAKMKEIGAGYGFAGTKYLESHGPDHILNCISELRDVSKNIFRAKSFS